uniref:Uncharacterized protein n=1 Tax=Dunaliella viridis TaxID=140095 RepID=D2SPD6_9CHLO|nr:hypothetical protein [Dunaliella viridis]
MTGLSVTRGCALTCLAKAKTRAWKEAPNADAKEDRCQTTCPGGDETVIEHMASGHPIERPLLTVTRFIVQDQEASKTSHFLDDGTPAHTCKPDSRVMFKG